MESLQLLPPCWPTCTWAPASSSNAWSADGNHESGSATAESILCLVSGLRIASWTVLTRVLRVPVCLCIACRVCGCAEDLADELVTSMSADAALIELIKSNSPHAPVLTSLAVAATLYQSAPNGELKAW